MKDTKNNKSRLVERPRYAHTLRQAAQELNIPISWLWYWAWFRWIKVKARQGRWEWVRIEDIRKTLLNQKAVKAAFEATGEPLSSSVAFERLLEEWPEAVLELWPSNEPENELAECEAKAA